MNRGVLILRVENFRIIVFQRVESTFDPEDLLVLVTHELIILILEKPCQDQQILIDFLADNIRVN